MYKISNFYQSRKYMHFMGKILSILLDILILPIIVFNLTLMVKSYGNPNEIPDFLSFKNFIIISESMEPTIMTGDVIFVKKVEPKELKINDIISFHDGNFVNTHRIVNITQDNGIIQYTTKGDHNKKEDKEKVTYDKIEGKYQFKITGFGKIIEILKNKITLVGLLIVLIFASIYQMRLVKRKLIRKEKRYEYNKLHHKVSLKN
ncbi:MAG: signal peptidase I [Clostridia bacterium]|nr:signal peptidase I [Clostridia bacterium]